MNGHAAVSPGTRIRSIGSAATRPALGRRAQDLTVWMRRVAQAEAVYARHHVDLSRHGTTLWRTLTAGRRKQAAALAFDELVLAVRGLRTAWDLFLLRAAAERLMWRDALRATLPGLLEDAGRRCGEVRSDTTFSYVAARSATEVAAFFSRRLENGCC
jgi:hypothetical protein